MSLSSSSRRLRWWQRRPVAVLRRWIEPYVQPVRFVRAVAETPRFAVEYLRYRRACAVCGMPLPRLRDLHPVFGQRGRHEFDAHYIHLNAWASRRVAALGPREHIDVGSQLAFTSVLSAFVPVRMVEIRGVAFHIEGISMTEGSVLSLPFADDSVASLSSLHVIEHIGLGRYGDPLDPEGTAKAARELARVLAPGGALLIGIPIGEPRVFFNGHRLHAATDVLAMFTGLRLVEFSGVDDAGCYQENRPIGSLDACDYACGFFLFTK